MRPLSLISCSVLWATVAVAQDVSFRFAPPVGKPFVQNLTTVQRTSSPEGGTQTREMTSRIRLEFMKDKEGYRMRGSTISSKTLADGKDVSDQMNKLISGVELDYVLDRNGKVKDIRGFDEFIRKMFDSVPEASRASLKSVINKDTLVAKEKAEWEGKITQFVGTKRKIGETWSEISDYAIPSGGTVKFYGTTTVAGRVKCGTIQCVRLTFKYHTDPVTLGIDIGKIVPQAKMDIATSGMTITGSGQRIVDSSTMSIHSETIERTMTMTVHINGNPQPMTRYEKKEYRFDYR